MTEPTQATPLPSKVLQAKVLQVSGLVKRYGADVVAVRGIDFDVMQGEVVGLLGPNGAGKTTTIECLVGLRRPSEGSVTLLGVDPVVERDTITPRVAVQPQSASLFEFQTVRETLDLFASFHAKPLSPDDVLADIGLAALASRRVKKLSGGERRRLLLAVALIGNPDVLVLDEPSAGLDPATRQSLWALIRALQQKGKTILLSTHHMDEATALCDRVIILVDGLIAAEGTPDELVRQHSRLNYVAFTVPREADLIELARIVDGDYENHDVSDGIRITTTTEDPDAVVRRLTFSTSMTYRDLSVRTSSLEDVFLGIAGNGGHHVNNH